MYRWVDHTAELELHIEAPDPGGVFADALAALGELANPDDGEREASEAERVTGEVHASAPDQATLLAEWLGELVYLSEAEGMVPDRIERFELRREEVEATVSGRRTEPRPLVKAVTYHRLALREEDGTWRARVVLDV